MIGLNKSLNSQNIPPHIPLGNNFFSAKSCQIFIKPSGCLSNHLSGTLNILQAPDLHQTLRMSFPFSFNMMYDVKDDPVLQVSNQEPQCPLQPSSYDLSAKSYTISCLEILFKALLVPYKTVPLHSQNSSFTRLTGS